MNWTPDMKVVKLDVLVFPTGEVPLSELADEDQAVIRAGVFRKDGWWDMRYRASRLAAEKFLFLERQHLEAWEAGVITNA